MGAEPSPGRPGTAGRGEADDEAAEGDGSETRDRINGRMGAPPPDPRTGARLAEWRTVVVAVRVTRAEPAAFGEPQAHRLSNATERGHEDVTGAGRAVAIEDRTGRRPPPAAPAGSKPSRRDQSRRRRGAASDPRHGRGECDAHSLPGQFFDKERGVACSPELWSKVGDGMIRRRRGFRFRRPGCRR